MSPTTPLPPDPNTTASIADAAKPISQSPARPSSNPYPFYSNPHTLQRLPSNPNPNYPHLAPRPPYHPLPNDPTHQFMYPGLGFMARQGMRPPMFSFPYLDHPSQAAFARSPGHLMMMPNVMRGAPMAISQHQYHQLKGGPPVSVTENNGHKDLRDRMKDDNFIIVRDRKVRITENASLYSLCRSWLRNGCTEETQLHFPDFFQPLPRPLPEQAQESSEKDVENKEEEDQDEESVKHLSAEDLLQRHVKRAKRVRSRLREKRHQRIARYKTRLSLLLHPPMVEQQQLKRETSPQN